MKKQILAAVMAAVMVTGSAGGIIPTSAPMFTSLTASAAEALQLEDGLYKMDIEMIKADHSGYSMSNNAVDHTVTLEVQDGKGYITVAFKGLAINDDFGYLKSLSYYDEGYKISKYGKLSGNVKNAEVLSYYTGIVDIYNDVDNPYPHMLKFPLVDGKELDEDGEQYVPLQVFVPIMEAISAGSGTQDVYMSLKWDTLEKKESNLTGTQLSVSGDITMNNYIELSDDLLNDSGAKVITSVNGYETEKLVSSVKGNATENGYAFPIGVPAKDMTSDVTVIFPQVPYSPQPMPAASTPPFAVTVPPLITILPAALSELPPIPAPPSLPLATRVPSPWMVSVFPSGTKMPA